jgi:hypothetical protein
MGQTGASILTLLAVRSPAGIQALAISQGRDVEAILSHHGSGYTSEMEPDHAFVMSGFGVLRLWGVVCRKLVIQRFQHPVLQNIPEVGLHFFKKEADTRRLDIKDRRLSFEKFPRMKNFQYHCAMQVK